MTDAEQKLTDWLRDLTPEPPRSITVAQIVEQATRDRTAGRYPRRRMWTPILAAAVVIAVVVAVLAFVASARNGHGTKPAASPSQSKPTPGPTSAPGGIAEPPPDFAATRLIGANGRYAWKLTDTLSITSDGGQRWSQVPLPPEITAASIHRIDPTNGRIDIGSDGTIVMTVVNGQTVDLYRRPPTAQDWDHTALVPIQPPGLHDAPNGPAVLATRGDGRTVALLIGWGTSPTHIYTDLFLSTDNGATFTQQPTNIGWGISSVLFLNANVGLVVAGPADNMVYRTADGGQSWQRVLGSVANVDVSFGALTPTKAGVVLPRMTGGAGLDLSLEVSTDEGATFSALTPAPLHLKHFTQMSADVPVTVRGNNVWVVDAHHIYESTDSGRTWTSVATAQPVHNIQLISGTQAIGLASATCTSNSDGCFLTDYLVATTDGGRTWRTL